MRAAGGSADAWPSSHLSSHPLLPPPPLAAPNSCPAHLPRELTLLLEAPPNTQLPAKVVLKSCPGLLTSRYVSQLIFQGTCQSALCPRPHPIGPMHLEFLLPRLAQGTEHRPRMIPAQPLPPSPCSVLLLELLKCLSEPLPTENLSLAPRCPQNQAELHSLAFMALPDLALAPPPSLHSLCASHSTPLLRAFVGAGPSPRGAQPPLPTGKCLLIFQTLLFFSGPCLGP